MPRFHAKIYLSVLAGAMCVPMCMLPGKVFAQARPGRVGTVAPTRNDPELERAQIAAATSNAFATLRADVLQRQITSNLTVGDFLKTTEGRDAFNTALHQANEIGGPRWIDEATCQIQLEISGDKIVQSLMQLANANPGTTPMPAAEIEQRLSAWKTRTFAATGSSIRADRVMEMRPFGVEAWQAVSDADRERAIAAARENAVARVLDELKPVQLDAKNSFDQVLDNNPPVKKEVADWLLMRPVTAINFRDDLQVQYTLSVSRRHLLEQFVASARKYNVALPSDDELAKVLARFKQEIANTTGVAPAKASKAIAREVDPVFQLLPKQPPAWIFEQIDAQAEARPEVSPLRTKRAAEERATESVRAKLLEMKLSDSLTVKQACEKSPAVQEAVSRAISRVRLYKVDYAADGSVTVKMMMDPREFWLDLTR